MATYTLSHTGAEVDAAVTNATNLFSTSHTWTAEQIFTNLTIQTGGLTVAEINTNEATIEYLRVDGGDAAAVFHGPATFFNEAIIDSSASLTVQGTATFSQNITVTGDVTAGSATIGGETDISGELIVTGNITGDRVKSTLDLIAGRSIRINSDKVTISFKTAAGTMSADGVYISTSGLTAVAEGGSYPANVLLIEFDY